MKISQHLIKVCTKVKCLVFLSHTTVRRMLQLHLLQLPLVDLCSLTHVISRQLSHWPSTRTLCTARSPTPAVRPRINSVLNY